ncbi:MAG TPA: hypothetical protein VGO43_08100 [Pyrinomonadaceae bacterium]|jgi:hypothetical protein|nr:hypothetical protein [Pyrinomonadaceae bacterium]
MDLYSVNRMTTRPFLVAITAAGMLLLSFTTASFGQKDVFEARRATSRAGLMDTGYMTKPDVSGDLDGSGDEYFYKFGAGPGKLTITLEVTANKENAGATVDLFDGNNKAILANRLTKGLEIAGITSKNIRSNLLAEAVDSGSQRVSRTVKLDAAQQDIVIRIKGIKYATGEGTGTYTIRVEGTAVVF